MSYTIRLLKKETIADNTMAFYFEKPEGFTYRAGQYGSFTLVDPPETDTEGNSRNFSFASAPYEEYLSIATRMRDTAFKRVLKGLPEGAELKLEGSYGSFMFPKDPSTPAIFLTGGIGATFVRSMVAQATHERSPQKCIFIYSNHSLQDAAFLDEFTELAAQNENFTFVPTMTEVKDQKWAGERGEITIEMLKKYVDDAAAVYYLSGPGTMVGAMRRLLREAKVGMFNIRSDQFIGY